MSKNQDLDKQIKLCKKLGAVQFQKIVFVVEKLKFKVLKKILPNYIQIFDKHVDRVVRKKLETANSDEERQAIIYKAKMDKMQERREFYQEKNRNYHISKDNPSMMIKYLEKNKEIHKNGLIRNGIFSLLMVPGLIFGSDLAIIIIILQLIEAGINFECINLQNYNICRLTKIADRIQQREKKKNEADAQRYKDVAKEIHQAVMEKDEIPTIDEVLALADTPEKLEQLRQLVAKVKSERNISKTSDEGAVQKVIK